MSSFTLKDVPERVDALLGDDGAAHAERRELREEAATWADADAPDSRTVELSDEERQERIEGLQQFHLTLRKRYHMDEGEMNHWKRAGRAEFNEEARRRIAEVRAAHEAGVRRRTPEEQAALMAELNRGREESGTWLDPDEVERLIKGHRM